MKIFDIDGTFYKIMTELADLVILSVYWIIGCLPIITIGTSTSALYYVYGKKIRKEDPYITREFVKSYKSNFKQSIPITLILIALWVSAFFYSLIRTGPSAPLWVSMAVAGFVLFYAIEVTLISLYSTAILSRFELSVKNTFLLAFIFTHKHLVTSFIMLLSFLILVDLALMVPTVLIVAPALLAVIHSFLLNKVFNKNMELIVDDGQSAEEDDTPGIYAGWENAQEPEEEDKDFLKYI
ncbi:MAG: hypothetical protein ATN34_01870 [Epulopiscium sp. Nele67-Bin002]|nr:MAG: hypothetical protein BEN18_01430 [Epulopiscium sp. Nuni2H_MBin001]OON91849.1 MAG: hypothetical protein ATN34_01870 [Epulopiscium sp. Nele67-Bin002]